jgi:hypothetical protein
MKDLIEALTIFLKYKNVRNPTHCEHDVLHVVDVTKEEVSAEDAARLKELGFLWSTENDGCWVSFRFGSA